MKKYNIFIWSLVLSLICFVPIGYSQNKEEWDDEGEKELQVPNSVEEVIDNVIDQMNLEADERRELLNFIGQNLQPLKEMTKKELEAIGNREVVEKQDDEDDGGDEFEDEDDLGEIVGEIYEHVSDEIEDAAHMLFEVKKEDPARFKQWLDYKKMDFKSYFLGIKIRDLKRKKVQTDEDRATIAGLEKELKSLLDKMFAQRLNLDKRDIEELNKEVEAMNEHIKFREKNKDRIIQRHFEELIGDSERLDW